MSENLITATVLSLLMAMSSVVIAAAPTTRPIRGDRRVFELNVVAPAIPAMRYQLTVDAVDRKEGDAASLYLQAILLLPADADDIVDKALDLHEAGNSLAAYEPLVKLLARAEPTLQLLKIATCKEHCDWNSPVRELGIATMLPHLNRMRQLANLLRVAGCRQIDLGRYDDAVQSIRMEYAMGRHLASGGPLVSSLVGLGVVAVGNTMVADLMNRPDAPNLYWPLINVPNPMVSLTDAAAGERQWLVAQMPILAKGKTGNISADDWPAYIRQLVALQTAMTPAKDPPNEALTSVALGMSMSPQASTYYTETKHLSADQVAKLDVRLVLATYVIEQSQIASDEQSKLFGLPMVELIRREAELSKRVKGLNIGPTNPVLQLIPSMTRLPITFGRNQRMIAALTTVEAVRSYAAAHENKLPSTLQDLTETPAPPNPMTGKPFDYSVDGKVATLSDTTSAGSGRDNEYPLIFSIKIRPR